MPVTQPEIIARINCPEYIRAKVRAFKRAIQIPAAWTGTLGQSSICVLQKVQKSKKSRFWVIILEILRFFEDYL